MADPATLTTGTLRYAINNATSGDTIAFSSTAFATYQTISLNQGALAIAQSLTITGPPEGVAIDGTKSWTVFTVAGGTVSNPVVISDLTIQNGQNGNTRGGGGILCSGVMTVSNCTLSGNSASNGGGYGGGICVTGSGNATVSSCTFTQNSAPHGGGMHINSGCQAKLTNCTFYANTGGENAGGLDDDQGVPVTNCTFTANTASINAGAIQGSSSTTLVNDICYGDSAPNTSELTGGLTASYCDIEQSGYSGSRNIDANPNLGVLANNGGPVETCAITPTSPCYETGTSSGAPSTDARGDTRPSPPSMGAYDWPPGGTFVLWQNNSSNLYSLWNVSAGAEANTVYGPYAGWSATSVASDTNGSAYLLWNHTSGAVSLWQVNPTSWTETNVVYGPYSGWTANKIAAGADGNIRILWTNTNGEISLWTVNPSNWSETNWSYGPYPGWTATTIGVGLDNQVRVLWTTASGATCVWLIDSDGSFTDANYGPYPGWQAIDLTVASTNDARILWQAQSAGNIFCLWDIASKLVSKTDANYGPV